MQAAVLVAGRSRSTGPLARLTLALAALAAAASAFPAPARAADAPHCSALVAGGPACGATASIGSADGGAGTAGTAAPGGAGAPAERFVGNPIDVVSGNKYQHRSDFRAFGSRLAFSRHYNTARTDTDRGLGRGWRHDYDVSLARVDETTVRLVQSDGREIDFRAVGIDAALEAGLSPEALSTGAVPHLPARPTDGHLLLGERGRWHLPDGRALEFAGPLLASVAWPDGDRLELGYRAGRLARVTDRHGRSIELRYTPGRIGLDRWEPATGIALPGHLERVVLPNGEALEYRYDHRKNLVRVDHAGEPIERLGYADPDFPNHLTELRSADGEDKGWHYDDEGRGDGYADGHGSVLMLEYLPGVADSAGERQGRTLVRRLDGAWLDYRWVEGADGGASIEAVIEHGCATCPGVPRPMTRGRPGDAGRMDAGASPARRAVDAGAYGAIAGLTIESLGADAATVSIDGGAMRLAVRFDRRARPIEVESLTDVGGGIRREADALREAVLRLDEVGTVDGSGTAYRARRKTSCPPPLFRTCEELAHDRELLVMSNCAYAVSGASCSPLGSDWQEQTAADLGVDPELLHYKNYDVRVWRNGATGELVVAFRGSDDVGDFEEDARQFNGVATRSYRRAKKLSDALDDQGFDVTYTGHSLGGGLATTAALANGQEAVVFNSAALHPDVAAELKVPLDRANESILGIHVEGDFVTVNQDRTWREDLPWMRPDGHREGPAREVSLPAPGRRYPLPPPPPGSPNTSSIPVLRNVKHHMTSALYESLGNVIDQQCGP